MDFVDRLSHEVLSGQEQIDLLRKIKKGDEEALNELIRCNQRYVASICNRYATVSSQDVEFDDLMQAGNIGLLKAIEMWDEKKNVQFSTYAFYWIRAKARRFALYKSTDLSISHRVSERMVAVRRARAQLLEKLRREPSIEEIAVHIDLTVEDVRDLFRVMKKSVRLDETQTGNERDQEETKAVFQLPDLMQDTEEEGLRKALIARVKKSMCKLSHRQQIVINHLYGLNGYQILSAGEVAARLGISRQAVDTLRDNGVKELRKHLTSFDYPAERSSTF